MATVRATIDLALEPAKAFDIVVEELVRSLGRVGVRFETGSKGRVIEGAATVGKVISWKRNERIRLRWRAADWDTNAATEVELRFERIRGGTRVVLEQRGWGSLIGDGAEVAGWFGGEVLGPLFQAITPQSLGDWLTDRLARRPSGPQARGVYRDPLYHYPNFRVILDQLALTPSPARV